VITLPLPQGRENILRVVDRTTSGVWADGLAWYRNAQAWAAALGQEHGKPLELVAGVTAALSPLTEWEQNKRKAEVMMANGWPRGIDAFIRQAHLIYMGKEPINVLRGPKVRAFFFAIRDAGEYNEAVVDRHALSVYFGRPVTNTERRFCKGRNTKGVQRAYACVATEVGVRPHELQAITWVQWRGEKRHA
jgi:hypothetical protein